MCLNSNCIVYSTSKLCLLFVPPRRLSLPSNMHAHLTGASPIRLQYSWLQALKISVWSLKIALCRFFSRQCFLPRAYFNSHFAQRGIRCFSILKSRIIKLDGDILKLSICVWKISCKFWYHSLWNTELRFNSSNLNVRLVDY